MGPHNPTARNTQIPTATTTTTFRMVLMLAAMGMKRLISHSATPTTIKASTRFTKGIWSYSDTWQGNPLATPEGMQLRLLPRDEHGQSCQGHRDHRNPSEHRQPSRVQAVTHHLAAIRQQQHD